MPVELGFIKTCAAADKRKEHHPNHDQGKGVAADTEDPLVGQIPEQSKAPENDEQGQDDGSPAHEQLEQDVGDEDPDISHPIVEMDTWHDGGFFAGMMAHQAQQEEDAQYHREDPDDLTGHFLETVFLFSTQALTGLLVDDWWFDDTAGDAFPANIDLQGRSDLMMTLVHITQTDPFTKTG